ncbi:MAG: hypothetical protein ACOCYB_00245 [Alkalispirochaeta sp.]
MSEAQRLHSPSILVPYSGADTDPNTLDVFVYLRPETNGVAVESTVMKVIKECQHRSSDFQLVYMANVPGGYIADRRIVERHYSLRLFFAVHGGATFSPDMREQFEEFYGVSFDSEKVIGAFDALRRFRWSPEDLFGLWVDEQAITRIAGQVIKQYQGVWVVNYDIPALLHKNNTATDIAVMAFRTREGYPHFFELAMQMKSALVERGLLRKGMPIARAVHISHSPFEQLLDARDYLLTGEGDPAGMESSSFAAFLMERGFSIRDVAGLVEHPICRFDFGVKAPKEQNLLDLCEGFGYEDALHIIRRIQAQSLFPARAATAGTPPPRVPSR